MSSPSWRKCDSEGEAWGDFSKIDFICLSACLCVGRGWGLQAGLLVLMFVVPNSWF